MKFRGHETFFIRKGWLSKGMRYVVAKPNVFVDKKENPMDVLGIGSNMVKSLRYWLQVTGLTFEGKGRTREQKLTEFGRLVFDNDCYIEEMGTLLLLHYKMASDFENATALYYFFNVFDIADFSKSDFIVQIESYIDFRTGEDGKKVARRSLEDDITCIINTYIPRYKTSLAKISAENNIDSPFGEIGLIDILGREKGEIIYKKSIPGAKTFNPWVTLAVIQDYAHKNGRFIQEISLSDLLNTECNIGRIFNLDSITMMEILYAVEKIGEIKIIRTAGLDVIRVLNDRSFEECVSLYYKSFTKK